MEEAATAATSVDDHLVASFEALANPLRVQLMHRLATPGFAPDLAEELGITRQAIKRHLEALQRVGLVVSRPARRGALPAQQYAASPEGLFAFKEAVALLALPPGAPTMGLPTRAGADASAGSVTAHGAGLLVVHGDAPGRWFPLSRGSSWVLGRDTRDDICLAYDPFASARHALLAREPSGAWRLTDLSSKNGTFVNFEPVASGASVVIRDGDLLVVGRSRLLLRDARP